MKGPRSMLRLLISLALVGGAVAVAAPAPAQVLPLSPPWNGQPISAGLGPTYGEPWCAEAEPGTSIANQQGAPLALIPQEAVGCTLAQFEEEAAAAGVPDRMDRFVIGTSEAGRPIHAAVVNALETEQQRRDYARWRQIREIELEDPAGAQALLDSFGADVKMPVFIQANIHGNEEEGADAIMQVLRDLVTLPRGTNGIVDQILDHSILIVIPMENPDGRYLGSRANGNGFDMNRDWLVQSQPEVRASVALQQEWLATAGLDMHGYVNPMLIDGTTKPHNPGIEYDTFLGWNQPRLDANEEALAAIGMGVQRPVNDWNQAGVPPGHPEIAEGWDDWGPFYTQTYMAFYGVDSSTPEMCSSPLGGACNGRLGGKVSQYVTFYSSMRFWLPNREAMMDAQLENFRRGVEDAERPDCCADPDIATRGFTEGQHDWMVEHPTAYVIPFGGGGQRSDAEANRLVRWLLDNGIQVSRSTEPFSWDGTAYPEGSYVVWMDQALRGLALTALSAGQDISNRILRLYAPPAAWSHGLLWGADVVEVPRGDDTFTPATTPISAPSALDGGATGRRGGKSSWFAVTLRGISEYRTVLELLRAGVDGEVAEEPFTDASGDAWPAGTLIFSGHPQTRKALDAAAADSGLVFEHQFQTPKPATTQLDEAPKVAVLANSTGRTDTTESLRAIFGPDVGVVSESSLEEAETDPLLGFDVIYNSGRSWPSDPTAQDRLRAFFERGGGYIATSQSTNNFSFLSGGGLVNGALTQGSQVASGGIATWVNVAYPESPLTGGYPAEDFLYLPSNVTYFTSTPEGATVAGEYHPDMTGAGPNGPSEGFVSGLWRNRLADANSAPVIVHGDTNLDSRYLGFATNPFSRQDAEREWPLIAQAVLWSNLTDDDRQGIAAERSADETSAMYPLPGRIVDVPLLPGERP